MTTDMLPRQPKACRRTSSAVHSRFRQAIPKPKSARKLQDQIRLPCAQITPYPWRQQGSNVRNRLEKPALPNPLPQLSPSGLANSVNRTRLRRLSRRSGPCTTVVPGWRFAAKHPASSSIRSGASPAKAEQRAKSVRAKRAAPLASPMWGRTKPNLRNKEGQYGYTCKPGASGREAQDRWRVIGVVRCGGRARFTGRWATAGRRQTFADFVSDAYAHCKFIGFTVGHSRFCGSRTEGQTRRSRFPLSSVEEISEFIASCAPLRLWKRELNVDLDAKPK